MAPEVDKLAIARSILRPSRGGAAGVVLVFSLGFALAWYAGLVGLPLALILSSWYAKYCFFLFDAVVRGFDEPPVLDIQMLNPLGERRPLWQLAITAASFALVAVVSTQVGSTPGLLLGGLVVACLPASIAVLGIEDNPLKAISPFELVRLIRGLGGWYLLVLGTIAAYFLLCGLWWRWMPWLPLQLVGPLFAVLSVVSLLAGALYARRDDLDIEVWHSPERVEDRRRREELARHEHVIDSAWNQARLGAHAVATKMLVDWLASRGNRPEDYHWVCSRLASWADTRHLRRVTSDYVDRLVRLHRHGELLDVMAERLKTMPDFRPASARTTLTVAQLAVRGGVPGVARALLSDFVTRFPKDPGADAAARLAAGLDV